MCRLTHIYIRCSRCEKIARHRKIKTVTPCQHGTGPLDPPGVQQVPGNLRYYILSNLPRETPPACHFNSSWTGQLDFQDPPQHARYDRDYCSWCFEGNPDVNGYPTRKQAANHIYRYDDIVQSMGQPPTPWNDSDVKNPAKPMFWHYLGYAIHKRVGDTKRKISNTFRVFGKSVKTEAAKMQRELVKLERVVEADIKLMQQIRHDLGQPPYPPQFQNWEVCFEALKDYTQKYRDYHSAMLACPLADPVYRAKMSRTSAREAKAHSDSLRKAQQGVTAHHQTMLTRKMAKKGDSLFRLSTSDVPLSLQRKQQIMARGSAIRQARTAAQNDQNDQNGETE